MSFRQIKRIFRHLFTPPWAVDDHFPPCAMRRIQAAITASEATHGGEIKFAVEPDLHFLEVWHRKSGKARAIEVFSQLHVWDTAHNNGVLIYLLIADHDFEIVADRGIHQAVGNATWQAISNDMEIYFRKGEFEAGVLWGIRAIGDLLRQHFPQAQRLNEIADAPVIL